MISRRILVVAVLLAIVLAIPFLLKPKESLIQKADDTLVVISPHNESIRYEFARGFAEHYKKKTGRTVMIDWRMPGGTSEIARYLSGSYKAAFEAYWKKLGKPWDAEAAGSFDKPNATTDARKAFLESNVGIGVDVFFGGGAYDFAQQAAAGRLVDSGVIRDNPEWFEKQIPKTVSGELFYDPEGRWIGTVLSTFGICFNTDSMKRLGVETLTGTWADLTNPKFVGQVALADPTKSGSAAKAFEMIIQQKMQGAVIGAGLEANDIALSDGWELGLAIIQRASANARYFTDSAPKVAIDVSMGDAAIGMCIDFMGRFQSEAVQEPGKPSRMRYFTPRNGSSVGVDPIGILRGAPNPKLAKEFIEYVLSLEGQKLWNFKVGTPGGPEKYALRRMPIRNEAYSPDFTAYRSDPDADPYNDTGDFLYHPEWTLPLFKAIAFSVRVMAIDPHDELVAAWKALIKADFPPEAMETFSNIDALAYKAVVTKIVPALNSPDRLDEVRLARELSGHFREQYKKARRLAEEGR